MRCFAVPLIGALRHLISQALPDSFPLRGSLLRVVPYCGYAAFDVGADVYDSPKAAIRYVASVVPYGKAVQCLLSTVYKHLKTFFYSNIYSVTFLRKSCRHCRQIEKPHCLSHFQRLQGCLQSDYNMQLGSQTAWAVATTSTPVPATSWISTSPMTTGA